MLIGLHRLKGQGRSHLHLRSREVGKHSATDQMLVQQRRYASHATLRLLANAKGYTAAAHIEVKARGCGGE